MYHVVIMTESIESAKKLHFKYFIDIFTRSSYKIDVCSRTSRGLQNPGSQLLGASFLLSTILLLFVVFLHPLIHPLHRKSFCEHFSSDNALEMSSKYVAVRPHCSWASEDSRKPLRGCHIPTSNSSFYGQEEPSMSYPL